MVEFCDELEQNGLIVALFPGSVEIQALIDAPLLDPYPAKPAMAQRIPPDVLLPVFNSWTNMVF